MTGNPIPDAERARRYRARRRAGAALVPVAVLPGHVRALQRLGLLAEGQPGPAEVGKAVARFLDGAGPISTLAAALAPD